MAAGGIGGLEEKLAADEVIVLDGATGTELEHRGAPMHSDCWCAMATMSHPDMLREIHEDYIAAGADLITANTFAGNRFMLEKAGLGDRFEEINGRAVEVALEARERADTSRRIAVAGSMSHMTPVTPGGDTRDPEVARQVKVAEESFVEMAGLLASAGVDMILMEMMSDPALAVPAVRAAAATGLPVWVGFSCRTDEAGNAVSWSRTDMPFADAAAEIMAAGGTVAGVMHSTINDTTPALEVLHAQWPGPVMAYPESGYFEMPNWRFVDIIPPEDFADQCLAWIEGGARIVGGCCGLGVEHIARLVERLQT